MKKILIVVDMQKDFVDGALGTAEAQAIIPAAVEKVKNHEGPVYFTRDTHAPDYLETQEGRMLPVKHCLRGTEGWEIIPELKPYSLAKGTSILDKPSFGSVALAQFLSEQKNIESIELIGLCTVICVISNALLLKAFLPEVPIFVDASCCAGVTPEAHRAALATMKSCQIIIKNEAPCVLEEEA